MPAEGNGRGLAVVEKYYQDYGCRTRELKKQGRNVMGYLCALVPLEMIAAAGFVPFRIKGDVNEPITEADTVMETIVCPLVRSCLDMSLKGNYKFLDGLVMPHACDSMCRTYDIWKYSLNLSYSHLINMPHTTDDSSLSFYIELLNTFRVSLSRLTGREISDRSLARSVQLYNRYRAKVRELYQLRKVKTPLISGTEVVKLLVAAMSIPVEEAIELIDSVVAEVKQRSRLPARKSARIMVVGAQIDNAAFIELIEDSGAWVVADDLCPGTRELFSDVDVTGNPVDGIAERYLRKVHCGRTYRERKGSYQDYIVDRFGHLGSFVKDFKVDGVVFYTYKYCDPYGFDVPEMKSYIESMDIPVLYLEDEYTMSTIGRLRTRIQAFLELIGK